MRPTFVEFYKEWGFEMALRPFDLLRKMNETKNEYQTKIKKILNYGDNNCNYSGLRGRSIDSGPFGVAEPYRHPDRRSDVGRRYEEEQRRFRQP